MFAGDGLAIRDTDSLRNGKLPWLGVKSNLLYDATTTINVGLEMGLSHHWTLDISANYNPWTFSDNRKWKHLLIQPELRYWFRHRFSGHFLGLHSGWMKYNAGGISLPTVSNSKDSRYEGYATGVGLSYGYSMPLSGRWALEFSLGAGWVYTRYDRFRCSHCGAREESGVTTHRFAPTKAAISVVYLLGGDPLPRRKRACRPLATLTDAAASMEERKRKAAQKQAQAQEEATRQAEKEAVQQQALIAEQKKLRSQWRTALETLNPATGNRLRVLFPSAGADIDIAFCGNDTILTQLVSAIALLHASISDPAMGAETQTQRLYITITGYASPDGKGALNRRLSEARAIALKEYLCKRIPALPDSLFVLHNAGEDWESVRHWVVNDPGMIYREEVLRIIDRVPVNSGRKKRLMDLKWGRPYIYLSQHCFPTLRNACCVEIRIEKDF